MELQLIYNWTYMEVQHLTMYLILELMDAIYLHNKFSKPCSWDTYFPLSNSPNNSWCKVRKIADYVCKNWRVADMYDPVFDDYSPVGQFGKFGPKNRFFIPTHHRPKS